MSHWRKTKPWRWEVILVAGLAFVILIGGWIKIGGLARRADDLARSNKEFVHELRDANIRGCQRQNRVRAVVRDRIEQDLEAARAAHKYFDTSAAEYRQDVSNLHDQYMRVQPARCRQVYPRSR